MTEQLKALRVALLAKASALSDVTANASDVTASRVDEFVTAVAELKQWVTGPKDLADVTAKDQLTLTLARCARY